MNWLQKHLIKATSEKPKGYEEFANLHQKFDEEWLSYGKTLEPTLEEILAWFLKDVPFDQEQILIDWYYDLCYPKLQHFVHLEPNQIIRAMNKRGFYCISVACSKYDQKTLLFQKV